MPYHLFLIEPQPLVRVGYRHVLATRPDLELVGVGATAMEGLRAARAGRLDLLLTAQVLPDMQTTALILDLARAPTPIPTLVVTSLDNAVFAEEALAVGAAGYITAREAQHVLLPAIDAVLQRRVFVSPVIGRLLLLRRLSYEPSDRSLARLTAQELEYLFLLGNSPSIAEAGRHLMASPTELLILKAHLRNKLGVSDDAALLQFAARWALQTG